MINFEILPPFTSYESGSNSQAAWGKAFFPIVSNDRSVLNADKNVKSMKSHPSQIKAFIDLSPNIQNYLLVISSFSQDPKIRNIRNNCILK